MCRYIAVMEVTPVDGTQRPRTRLFIAIGGCCLVFALAAGSYLLTRNLASSPPSNPLVLISMQNSAQPVAPSLRYAQEYARKLNAFGGGFKDCAAGPVEDSDLPITTAEREHGYTKFTWRTVTCDYAHSRWNQYSWLFAPEPNNQFAMQFQTKGQSKVLMGCIARGITWPSRSPIVVHCLGYSRQPLPNPTA
jgi:hypothetical protein